MNNKSYIQNQYIKKPGAASFYNEENINDLIKSAKDVNYFIEKFVKIQHPTKGAVNFKLYPYQKELIKTFDSYKYVIALTGRQLGKCISSETIIDYNGKRIKIGKLLFKYLDFREKAIYFLEKLLVILALLREKHRKQKLNSNSNFFSKVFKKFFN